MPYAKISFLFFLFIGICAAQESKVKKANDAYETYSFINAQKIYLKVVEDGYESPQVFKKLGDTYYFNSEYKEAVQWYDQLLKKYPSAVTPIYQHRASQSFKSIGEYQKSKDIMEAYAQDSRESYIAGSYLKNAGQIEKWGSNESKSYQILNVSRGLNGSDFGPSFYGDKIVYASSSKNTEGSGVHEWNGLPYLDLYIAELDEQGVFVRSKAFDSNINTPYHESSACFTKDGQTMYFTRNNYINGKKRKGKNKLVSLKIFKAVKQDNGTWGQVEELPFNNDSYAVAHPALNSDESKLYFSSDMPGTLGMSDLWYVDILPNGSYGNPKNQGSSVNTEARESFPFISSSNHLYFSSDGHLGLGGLDVFKVSLNEMGKASGEVFNLESPLNSALDDFGLIINEHEKTGYLSSNRDGEEGSRSDDIYRFYESCKIAISGLVLDEQTGEVIPRSTVTLLDDNNQLISQIVTDEKGFYTFEDVTECDRQYIIRAANDALEYEPNEKPIVTPKTSSAVTLNLELTPPECPVNDLGCRLDLQPIYFDFNKHNIRTDAEVELAKILSALKEYPQLKIHIESHTDSRGTDSYNELLSDRRAKSTLEWLVIKGIARQRLSAKGYGEKQLINKCSNGVSCSEGEHQLNRRSMFIIQD